MFKGNKVFQNNNGDWVFSDGSLVSETWKNKPCGHCKKKSTTEGHDACLGTLSGVMNACCGHGITREAHIQLLDGVVIEGQDAVTILEVLKRHKHK